jgi:hypothetical protein
MWAENKLHEFQLLTLPTQEFDEEIHNYIFYFKLIMRVSDYYQL